MTENHDMEIGELYSKLQGPAFIPEACIPPLAEFVEEWMPDEKRKPRFQAVMFDAERFTGDGDTDQDAFSLVNFVDGGVEIIPFKDIDEKSKYYQQLRSFCFPTRTTEEIMGQALLAHKKLFLEDPLPEPIKLKPQYQQNYLALRKKRF